MIKEFLQDINGGHLIAKTVCVEAVRNYEDVPKERQPVRETEFIQSITDHSTSRQHKMPQVAAGIVGFADLTLGSAISPVLEAHIAAGRNRFRGVRQSAAWDSSSDIVSYMNPPKGLLLNRKFREGFACLQKYNLSFDAWIYHTQLSELIDLAKAFPEIPIVLDHVGGPLGIGPYARKRDEIFQEWKRGITELASCPNVVLKLGGLGIPLCGFGWHKLPIPPSSIRLAYAMMPYYNLCIEKFGVDRCMFESNFPVDKVSYSYTIIWNAFKRISEHFSQQERAALFYNTAVQVYRL